MVLIPYLTLATLLEHMAQRQNQEDAATLKCRIPDLAKVFNSEGECKIPKLSLQGRLRVCRTCARALLNVFLFSFNLADLPPRNPLEPLNQTKHLLVWLEFGGAWSIVLLFLLKPLVLVCCDWLGLPFFALYRPYLIRKLANFSALALLQQANPQECVERIGHAYTRRNAAVFLAEVVSALFGASIGVAALVVKISATAFIASEHIWDWNVIQWLTLVGLLNNIVGLIQIEELRIATWHSWTVFLLVACYSKGRMESRGFMSC